MTKKHLDTSSLSAQTTKLNPDLVVRLDLTAVIYGERTQLGGMGNSGGIILYAIEDGHFTRYETSYRDDEVTWSDAQLLISHNKDLFNFYAGGMGNGVFIKKGIALEVKHYTSESDLWNSHFVYQQDGLRYRISSSVYGVFRNVARTLTESGQMPQSKSIGAIVGDIVGSPYEFDNIKTKDFPLFSEDSCITDDSILTIATMQALMDGGSAQDFTRNYQLFGNKHPSSYGGRFREWLLDKDPQPYNSWGNGSAMRVSPVAWFYNSLVDVEEAATTSASVTHNHPEGIKGAQATAAAIFMARTGKSKQEIKDYIEDRYEYMLDFKLSEIRPTYDFDESCAGTVPFAIVAFLESTDFEDTIRNAVSIGGDSDTIAAIAGSIAEAFYGIPDILSRKVLNYLSDDLKNIVERFNAKNIT